MNTPSTPNHARVQEQQPVISHQQYVPQNVVQNNPQNNIQVNTEEP